MSKDATRNTTVTPYILIFDSHGRVAFQNSVAAQLFGDLNIDRTEPPQCFSQESWQEFTQNYKLIATSDDSSQAWAGSLELGEGPIPILWQMGREAHGVFVIGTSAATVENLPGFAMSQQSLKNIVANVPGMVYQFKMDVEGNVSFPFVSQHAFGLYGVTAEDFRKDPALFLNRVHPDFKIEVQQRIQQSAERLETFSFAGKIVTESGAEKWIQARSVPARQSDGSILWSGIVTDHSHEKFLEEEIQKQRAIAEHQSKLASIGQLASGIGHEINNPLMILTGKIQKLKQQLVARGLWSAEFQALFESHSSAAFRMRKIVDGLRNFSRREEEVSNEFSDVGEVIRQTYFMISELLDNDGIHFQFDDLSGGRVFAQFPSGKLQQILINLISNARDAMTAQNQKTLRLELTAVSDAVLRIQIEDSGTGIPDNLKPKMFEPFFTTKEVGKGTGLGLSLSRTIAKRFGGDLELVRTGPTGSLFELRIPRGNCPQDISTKDGKILWDGASAIRNAVKVNCLIVDDEPEIREILRDLLESQIDGTVYEASQGFEALDFLTTPQGRSVQLVLTDLTMPRMGGRKLVSEIRGRLGPSAPKIYVITGRVQESGADSFIDSGADGYLQKPFGIDEIQNVLTEFTSVESSLGHDVLRLNQS